MGTAREALRKVLLRAQAQLQIQIGHAMATSRLGMPWQREERSFVVDSRVVATGLNTKRKKGVSPTAPRLHVRRFFT